MNDQRSPSPIICRSCGAHIDIKSEQTIIQCPYCGAQYAANSFLNESDAVAAERIKAQTAKEIEAARMKSMAEKEALEAESAAVDKFKKGRFSKFLIFCAIVSALVAALNLSDGLSLSGVIALIQAVLYLTAWLMGMGVIKEKKKNIRILVAVVAFALIIPFFRFSGRSNSSSYETEPEAFAWTDIEMREALPEPEKLYGEIERNSKTALSLTLCQVTDKDFKRYREECIVAGYTIEADETSHSYAAYDQAGYRIRLAFYESNEEMTIYLDAPEELGEFEWPTSGPGSMLPPTSSRLGDITKDSSHAFTVQVGNTPMEEYREYVKACEAKGFTVDYSKEDACYSALNPDGYKLTLRYLGFNRIEISLTAPQSTDSTSQTEQNDPAQPDGTSEPTAPTESTKPKENLVNGMRPEFKEAMDSYEAFFDEYCSFMKKYMASSGTDVKLLLDYAKYMGKYTEMMQAFAAWEDDEMNNAETAYYIQVQARINAKLLEVAQ